MRNFSLPVKIAILMVLAVAIVSAAGYLTFKNISLIIRSIEVKSKPDLRLSLIKDISADIDKAESSVRVYRMTQKQSDIKPYYTIISNIDEKIDSLRKSSNNDPNLLLQIDTISSLIEENMVVWNKMLDLYHTDSIDVYIRTLAAKIAVGTLNKKISEKNILKRVFSRKALKEEAQQKAQEELMSDLNKIERHESLKNSLLMETETRLAITENAIRDKFYLLISRMENDVISTIKENSKAADKLAFETYKWLGLFAVLGTLLVITVIIVVVKYVRKTKEYQKALEQSKEETEMLSRTKEMFMANMSHEIRTPVNAIYGFTEQLSHESLDEESSKMVGVIKSASEHLFQIVNDILDYSKLQNAKIELSKSDFMLRPLFEEINLMFLKNSVANNSQLNCLVTKSTPDILHGDSYRLKQILFNLVSNAIKFTSNGEIRLTADAENFDGDNFNLVLTITDTGIGISYDMQSKVFDDFTQAEIGTSRKYGGTGLGLSIVKKLVELHNGTINLKSQEGKGTTITCILPYNKGNEINIPIRSQGLSIPKIFMNLKFLIVDDEEYNRLLFKTIFTRWNSPFEVVNDGLVALNKIKSEKFDVIFMDVRMPGLNGLEAVKLIRNDLGFGKNTLPVIGTSASHSLEELQMYLSGGMNAFLPKPFTEDMLIEVIQKVINETGHTYNSTNKSPVRNKLNENAEKQEIVVNSVKLNLSNLYHLAGNDLSFVKQLLQTYLETTEEGLSIMKNSINSKNYDAVRETAHKISSPCRHIGAENLYTNLKMIEEQSKNNKNIGILANLYDDSIRQFNEIKDILQVHLEKI